MISVVTRLSVGESGVRIPTGTRAIFFFEVQNKFEVNPSTFSFVKKNLGLV
jgi:hypothetical protein